MSDKIGEKAELYSKRRDELLGLLKEANDLRVPEPYRTDIAKAHTKCLENQFEILLMGEFQGGKSTTFNFLCDGRELSPRGVGLKTSAVLMSAQNISNGEAPDGMSEWAELTYKTKENLWNTISSLFVGEENVPQTPDLDNPEQVKQLKKSLDEDERKKYLEKFSSGADRGEDRKDQVKIANLILKFYGTKEHREFVSRKVKTIEDVQQDVVFPTDWGIKDWTERTFDEVKFLFIASVLFRVRAKNLQRLGCRVTDCPGLFVNQYDTEVALGQLAVADGIWYLTEGDKGLKNEDKQTLTNIITPARDNEAVVTANIASTFQSQDKVVSGVFPVNEKAIKKLGFNSVYPYNALLALLAEQGQELLRNNDNGSVKGWCTAVHRVGVKAEIEQIEDVTSLDQSAIDIVRKHSMSEPIVRKLTDTVVSRKAASILIGKGSRLAADALNRYVSDLKAEEDNLAKTEAEFHAEFTKAAAKLQDTVAKCYEMISNDTLMGNAKFLSDSLAKVIVNSVLASEQFIDKCAQIMAVAWHNHAGKFFLLTPHFQNAVSQESSPQMVALYRQFIQSAIANLKHSGESVNEYMNLRRNMQSLEKQLQKTWQESVVGTPLLDGISPQIGDDEFNDLSSNVDEVALKVLKDADLFVPEILQWLGTIIKNGVKRLVGIFGLNKDAALEITKIAQSIKDDLRTSFNDAKLVNGCEATLSSCIQKYIKVFVYSLQSEIDRQETDFDERRVKPAEASFRMAQSERERAVAEHRELRTKVIQPLRKRIEDFEAKVRIEFTDDTMRFENEWFIVQTPLALANGGGCEVLVTLKRPPADGMKLICDLHWLKNELGEWGEVLLSGGDARTAQAGDTLRFEFRGVSVPDGIPIVVPVVALCPDGKWEKERNQYSLPAEEAPRMKVLRG